MTTLAEWSARTYGPGWEDTKRRYWASRFTRKRCFWCRRANPGRRWSSRRRLQLNHLTYVFSDATGRCPLGVVRPMCGFCHRVETWLTRQVRPGMARHRQRWAHAYVTYAVRWSLNLAVWGVVLIAAVQI